jgi:6-pyruvoyltetrahydropterin/6-carboxytetrahydropterin synthase
MLTVSKEIEFDAGHRVPNHKSKCRNPHGHRYRVRVTISGELVNTPGASNEGMLADFGDLKLLLQSNIHDVLDHGFIVHAEDDLMLSILGMLDLHDRIMKESLHKFKVIVLPFIPTAENLAVWIWRQMVRDISDMGFQLTLVELWETPTSLATYTAKEQ